MFDILVTGSVIYTGKELIRDGYIYIKNGKVIDYGKSPVPEDYTFVNLILGGKGRIIVPSLTAVIDAVAYPIRIFKPSLKDRVDFYDRLTTSEAETLALPAIYEAHMAGIGYVIIEYTNVELPNRLLADVGGHYGLAYPACKGAPPTSEVQTIITVEGEGCTGKGVLRVEGSYGYIDGNRVLAMFKRPTYSKLEGDPLFESNRLREALGLRPALIEKNTRAEIAVYNASKPPGMFLDYADIEFISRIYSAGIPLESLIVGDTILVDQGEHLYIVEKHFSEARKTGAKLLERR